MEGAYCSALENIELWNDIGDYEERWGPFSYGFAWSGYTSTGEWTEESLLVWWAPGAAWSNNLYNMDRYGIEQVHVDYHRYGWGGYLGYEFTYTPP